MDPPERPRELPLLPQGALAVDYDYLTRRMTEEVQRAAAADNQAARDAHLELAEHYATLIERMQADQGDSGMQAATA